MQHQFSGPPLDLRQRHFVQQRDRILIELSPARGIQVAKQADALVVPAPPHVARQFPELLLRGRNKPVERPRLAHHGRNLGRRLHQHANFIVAKDSRVLGLHHQHALQNAAVDQRHAEKGVVLLFARFLEVFVAWMFARVGHCHWNQLFGDQAGKAFVQGHAQCADRSRVKAQRSGEHQIRPVRLQQVGRAHVGPEPRGDQGHHVHQRVGRLALLLRQVGDLLQRQNQIGISGFAGVSRFADWGHRMRTPRIWRWKARAPRGDPI